jgi:hypothetical protein
MLPAGFEHVTPASEWLQTHAVERAATGISNFIWYDKNIYKFSLYMQDFK